MAALRTGVPPLIACVLFGCGVTSNSAPLFADIFDTHAASFSAPAERISAGVLEGFSALAIGATDSRVLGLDLLSGVQWEREEELRATPVFSGGIVVLSTSDHWIALDARSGRVQWKRPHQGQVVIAVADDGERTLLSIFDQKTGKHTFDSVNRQGAKLFSLSVHASPGAPSARGGVAYVPWNESFVSALDLDTGKELWRFEPGFGVTWAEHRADTVWFGGTNLGRLAPHSTNGSVSLVGLPDVGLAMLAGSVPGYRPPVPMTSAPVGVNAVVVPATASPPHAAGEFAAVGETTAIGFNSKHQLRWVSTLPSTVLAARPSQGGYVLCEMSGRLTNLASGGAATELADFGATLRTCALSTVLPPIRAGSTRIPVGAQLASAIRSSSGEGMELRVYLAQQLGKVNNDAATEHLIELASDPNMPQQLAPALDAALAGRRIGKTAMLRSLEQHFDFLDDNLYPPPVGPLADALAALNEPLAAPLLAKHLNDPANSADAVRRAARALQSLATLAEAPALRTFITLYRATADRRELVEAVLFTARALLRLGDTEGGLLIRRAASDALTQPEVRRGFETILRNQHAET